MIFYAKEYEHTPVSLLAEMPFIFLGMLQDATVVTTFPDISYLWIYISQSPLQNKKRLDLHCVVLAGRCARNRDRSAVKRVSRCYWLPVVRENN